MSFLGFFKATIENWKNLPKKTPKNIREMKEAIKQYEWSKWCDDFLNEDKNEVIFLEKEFKIIYNEIYNHK